MPGSGRPSRNSRDAPPPVDRWSNEPSRPAARTAASESPPPTTVKAGEAATARATPRVPASNGAVLEDPHRAVPQDRLRAGEDRPETLHRARADVETLQRPRDGAGGHRDRRIGRGDIGGGHDVDRQLDRDPLRAGALAGGEHRAEPIGLDERAADLAPVGGQERERHRAADQEGVDAIEQRVDHPELVRHLRAAQDRDVRPGRIAQELPEDIHLTLEQASGDGRPAAREHQLRQRAHRRVCAMDRSERVVDVRIGQLREPPGERRIVPFLPRIEPQVLEQHDRGVRQGAGRHLGDGDDLPAQELTEPRADRRQAEVRAGFTFRAAQVRCQHQRGAALEELEERRHDRADPAVIPHRAVDERDVEVHAHEHAGPAHLPERLQRPQPRAHRVDVTISTRSTMRFE